MGIILLVLGVLLIYLIVRQTRQGGETPLDILKKRYARGDITREEFEQKKRDLDLQ